MHLLGQACLLFALNFLDAVLTIYWVRNGFATEGNQLMAILLDIGDVPFLLVKLSIGAIAADCSCGVGEICGLQKSVLL